MIRVTKTSKLFKQKNPHLEDIEDFIEENSFRFRFIGEGIEGKAFYFKLNKRLVLNTEILQPGEYVLKILHEDTKYSLNQIKKLKLISKYGLIPKIFVVTNKYIVMKYIKGDVLIDLNVSKSDLLRIDERVDELSKIWKKLGLEHHIDFFDGNILVSEDLNHVYTIDPFLRTT